MGVVLDDGPQHLAVRVPDQRAEVRRCGLQALAGRAAGGGVGPGGLAPVEELGELALCRSGGGGLAVRAVAEERAATLGMVTGHDRRPSQAAGKCTQQVSPLGLDVARFVDEEQSQSCSKISTRYISQTLDSESWRYHSPCAIYDEKQERIQSQIEVHRKGTSSYLLEF